MKDAGFRFEPVVPPGGVFNATGAWVRDNQGPDLAQDRLIGERTFRKVVDLMRREQGIESPTQELEGRF